MDTHCDEKNISSAIDRIHSVLAEERIKIGDIDLVFDFVKTAVLSETVTRKEDADPVREAQGDLKIETEKRRFVEEQLSRLLRVANPDVATVCYAYVSGDEFVDVHMKNGVTYQIDVTADSFIAIACDVIRFMQSK